MKKTYMTNEIVRMGALNFFEELASVNWAFSTRPKQGPKQQQQQGGWTGEGVEETTEKGKGRRRRERRQKEKEEEVLRRRRRRKKKQKKGGEDKKKKSGWQKQGVGQNMTGFVKNLGSKLELVSKAAPPSSPEMSSSSSSSSLVVLHFWASWCEPCKAMDLVFAQLAADTPHAQFFRV
jgi:hypothetical protein